MVRNSGKLSVCRATCHEDSETDENVVLFVLLFVPSVDRLDVTLATVREDRVSTTITEPSELFPVGDPNERLDV